MKLIISKNIIALTPGGGLLEDEHFRNIRERIFNENRYRQTEDTGNYNTKKTVVTAPGMGSNDRGHNPGAGMGLGRDPEESKNRSLSSGYNDGEAANDETGPGNTPVHNSPYYATDVMNELFMDLKLKGDGYYDSVSRHLNQMLNGPAVIKPHKRHPV